MTWEEISKELFEEKTAKRFQWVFIKDNELELRDNGIIKRFNNERLEELLNELNEENMMLKGEVAHYKLILMSLEEQAKRLSEIHCVGD